ncbi:uncharacterized protein LOC126573089 isoform X2 [Anopheles aquasalis]|uniref:uncharacterized protein LOC126573089 isoform X2 n=1 Tax=Anopheles aquasalis TaxID=42839 RepID=UPI00215A8CCB|nr:uncharacterized protein LOC126573089 isoform X2 [Anopheles aquasalis]
MAYRWTRPLPPPPPPPSSSSSSSSSTTTAASSPASPSVLGDKSSSIAPISSRPAHPPDRPAPIADGDRNGDGLEGGVVCGLIGKFECTQPPTTNLTHADVKVTVNSGRDSGNDAHRLITADGTRLSSPLAHTRSEEGGGSGSVVGGAPTATRCIRGAVRTEGDVCYECSDKMATMEDGGSASGSAAVACAAAAGTNLLMPSTECSRSTNGTGLKVPSLRRFTKRQRKTVVYSRLCLDGTTCMFDVRSPPSTVESVVLVEPEAARIGGQWRSAEQCAPGAAAAAVAAAGGWARGQAEVIRFPCVERLIELYANIIREKEAEMQRFMSSIVVREGDKSRLDKSVSSSTSSLPPSSLLTTVLSGDIRTTAPGPPVSVSSEPSSYTASSIIDLSQAITPPATGTDGSSGTVVAQHHRREDNPDSPASDEGWRSIQQSPSGSSSDEEADRPRIEEKQQQQQQQQQQQEEDGEKDNMKHREKVTRSASSDSALGLDEDLSQQEQQHMMANVGKARRLTLGVSDIPLRSALLPVPEPSMLPTTTTDSLASLSGTADHLPTVVRSKMILEAQLIELPVDTDQQQHQNQQQQLGCPPSTSASRRESAQSYISDTGEGVRYVRTPSVVVSDYSDDTMCGITLEEIEYFRRHRLRRGSADCESDISAASSCSNLNYCGSSISALDGCEYQCGLRTPERKVSDCSTCSTVSCDEDEGYSVVRAKLANLSPSLATSSTSSNKGSSVAVTEVSAETGPAGSQSQETDVRICSKQQKPWISL